jgi:hypothetical protein
MDPLQNNSNNGGQGGALVNGATSVPPNPPVYPTPPTSSSTAPAPLSSNPVVNPASSMPSQPGMAPQETEPQPQPLATPQLSTSQHSGYAAAPDTMQGSADTMAYGTPAITPTSQPAQDYSQAEDIVNTEFTDPLSSLNSSNEQMLQPVSSTNSSQKMDINYTPDPVKKKSKLKILIIALIAIAVLAGGALFYLNTMRTSVAVKREFSAATSSLSSSSSSFTLSASVVALNSSNTSTLEDAAKDLDDAIGRFEVATAKLKSDEKGLKSAAEGYLKELKAYRSNEAKLAIEVSKINAAMDTEGMNSFSSASVSSPETYFAEVDRISAIYASSKNELEKLELNIDKSKELRGIYVSMLTKYVSLFAEIKTAVSAGDTAKVSSIQSQIASSDREFGVSSKENEIEDILDTGSENAKRLEAARKALNSEITKLNERI